MSVLSEKRTGNERRLMAGVPPAGIGERRIDDRRQMVIMDISFFEWATHFASFCRKLAGNDKRQIEAFRTRMANGKKGSR